MRELVRRPPPPFAAELARARGPAGGNVSPVSAHSVPTKKTRAPPSPPLFADASFVLANETAPS